MQNKLATKYNPYAREAIDDLFLLDEDFDHITSPMNTYNNYLN